MSARVLVMAESRRRSIVKAVTYRVLGSSATCIGAWVGTRSIWTGLSIGLADSLVKVVSFCEHERAWHRVRWGIVQRDAADGRGGGI